MSCDCHYCSGGDFDCQEVWEGERKCECGHTLWHSHCFGGCDDGWFDGAELDPLWYGNEMVPCRDCRGAGYLTFCPACEKRWNDEVDGKMATKTFC